MNICQTTYTLQQTPCLYIIGESVEIKLKAEGTLHWGLVTAGHFSVERICELKKEERSDWSERRETRQRKIFYLPDVCSYVRRVGAASCRHLFLPFHGHRGDMYSLWVAIISSFSLFFLVNNEKKNWNWNGVVCVPAFPRSPQLEHALLRNK